MGVFLKVVPWLLSEADCPEQAWECRAQLLALPDNTEPLLIEYRETFLDALEAIAVNLNSTIHQFYLLPQACFALLGFTLG